VFPLFSKFQTRSTRPCLVGTAITSSCFIGPWSLTSLSPSAFVPYVIGGVA
jgi:hypothetical protein